MGVLRRRRIPARELRQGEQAILHHLSRKIPAKAMVLLPGLRAGTLLWASGLVSDLLVCFTLLPAYPSQACCYALIDLASTPIGVAPFSHRRLTQPETRFNLFHPEKIPSVQKRYNDEIKRVVGVLDGHLAKSTSGWLVGEKCTFADLAFFMWNAQIEPMMSPFPGEWDISAFPHFKKWQEALEARPAVKKVVDAKAELLAKAQH